MRALQGTSYPLASLKRLQPQNCCHSHVPCYPSRSTDHQTYNSHVAPAKQLPKLLRFPPLTRNYPQELVACRPAHSANCQRCACNVTVAKSCSQPVRLPSPKHSYEAASHPAPHSTQPQCPLHVFIFVHRYCYLPDFCPLLSAP